VFAQCLLNCGLVSTQNSNTRQIVLPLAKRENSGYYFNKLMGYDNFLDADRKFDIFPNFD